MTYDHPASSETVYYTIPHWAIVSLQYSFIARTRLFIYHNCYEKPNVPNEEWKGARWHVSNEFDRDPNKCWKCEKHIPDDIQTIYTLLSME